MTKEIEKALDSVAELLAHLKENGSNVSLSEKAMNNLKNAGGGPFFAALKNKKKGAAVSPANPGGLLDNEQAPDINTLDDISKWIGDCQRCELYKKRTKIVFGVGAVDAKLMFIGEGPGRDEDIKGEPFVGAAGRLLTKMIEGGLGKTREDVYIANIVKCRPPGNREPKPDEATACGKFLDAQIDLVKPKVICALGRIAAQNLLRVKTPIGKMRGKWHLYKGIKVMPTFHPAALLRNPSNKRPAWEDLKMIMSELGWEMETGKVDK